MKAIDLLLLFLVATAAPNLCSAASPGEMKFVELIDRADESLIVPLWPDDGEQADGEQVVLSKNGKPGIRDVSRPSIVIVPPPRGTKPTGVTIVFAPGGAYNSLSLPNATDLYQWSSEIGAHFVLLKYRVPRSPADPGHRIPLSDAKRAIRLLRSRAAQLGLDPHKIIMAGSSAGGHLAMNLSNNHSDIADADKLSAKPNATLLLYPAYLTKPTGSLESDSQLQLDQLSPDRTPPVFMVVTHPDKFVWGAVNTMLRLRRSKVASELHVYPYGGHGGCFDKYPLMEFVRPAARFLADQGLFTQAMQAKSNEWLDRHKASFLSQNQSGTTADPTIPVTGSPLVTTSQPTAGDQKLAAVRKPAATVFPLWPGDAARADDPGREIEESLPQKDDGLVRITNVARPSLHHWPAENGDGRAVIVFPGGAYNMLAAQHEGTEIAQWLNSQGITAFVAKYRVPRRKGLEKHAVALQDAQRAIRLVRSRATDFGIDPGKLGVLGFSAGGNLATLTVHHANESSYAPIDALDDASARPDFAILIYPAYLAKGDKDVELDASIKSLPSNKDYPPTYLAVAADDRFAPGSLHYALHLHQMKAPAELHVYASGGHGKGLRESGGPFAQWTQSAARWLADQKLQRTNVSRQ